MYDPGIGQAGASFFFFIVPVASTGGIIITLESDRLETLFFFPLVPVASSGGIITTPELGYIIIY